MPNDLCPQKTCRPEGPPLREEVFSESAAHAGPLFFSCSSTLWCAGSMAPTHLRGLSLPCLLCCCACIHCETRRTKGRGKLYFLRNWCVCSYRWVSFPFARPGSSETTDGAVTVSVLNCTSCFLVPILVPSLPPAPASVRFSWRVSRPFSVASDVARMSAEEKV